LQDKILQEIVTPAIGWTVIGSGKVLGMGTSVNQLSRIQRTE
jgi:hypothetical protein